MKIYVLIENTTSDPTLSCEHGLSLFVETGNHKILFDTGQTGDFAENAAKMGVDLRQADLAVISHGHYDHGGGLRRFLDLNDHAPVYLSGYAFMPHMHGKEKDIGLDPWLAGNSRLVGVGDELILDKSLSLHSCNRMKPVVPVDSSGLNMLDHGTPAPEVFRHEQYLLVREENKKILFSGCSHKGILNIVEWFKPDVLIGGFHFSGLDPESADGRMRLEDAARRLMAYPTQYMTGHCTGVRQYEFLKKIMGDRLEYLSTGTSAAI